MEVWAVSVMDLTRFGAQVSGQTLSFGVLLPWVTPDNGQSVSVKVVHERDQFMQGVPPVAVELGHSVDASYGDLWSGSVDLSSGAPPGSAWGRSGRYLYRFCISRANGPAIDWIADPFAREYGVGKISAVSVPAGAYSWGAAEADWRVPALSDLVIYELNLAEFAAGLTAAAERLPYLADLGVNCLELMPVNAVAPEVDWGYLPVGYFGVDERLGDAASLKAFIERAHSLGLAVVLDVVYGHTGDDFPYQYAYTQLGYAQNPFMGDFGAHQFGHSIDYTRALVRDYFFTANTYWLSEFHLDGFRYDDVPDFWDGPTGDGYADLAYRTYELVRTSAGTGGPWARFLDGAGEVTLIQCAEKLDDPVGVLQESFSNLCWQDGTLGTAVEAATGAGSNPGGFGLELMLLGYPDHVVRVTGAGSVAMPTTAVQYLENHDHPRFLCNFGTIDPDVGDPAAEALFRQGDRDRWFKLQPYLIALLTAPGVPLLWQGQEFGENYTLPPWGLGRTLVLRPVQWHLFYDLPGQFLVRLVRALLRLRRRLPQLRGGSSYLYDDPYYTDQRLLVFSRGEGSAFTLVAVNLGDADVQTTFSFPAGEVYHEQLARALGDADPQDLTSSGGGAATPARVPSNYGGVWTA